MSMLLLSPWRTHGQALFSPGPSALPVSPGLPMHVQRCHRFCFTVPRERSAPILQPSRTETLIKLFENPIKMLYESVCHRQRFREENQATPKAKKTIKRESSSLIRPLVCFTVNGFWVLQTAAGPVGPVSQCGDDEEGCFLASGWVFLLSSL